MKVFLSAFVLFCFYSSVHSLCCNVPKPDPCAVKAAFLEKVDSALERTLQMKSKVLMYHNLHRQMHRCRHCNAAPCGTFSPVEPLSSCQMGKPLTFSTFNVYPSHGGCW